MTAMLAEPTPWTADEFVARLRAQGVRYYDVHPFHLRMNTGALSRRELARWVANRFYYQRCLPLKDAAILSNCPDVDVRRVWIRRILGHDGTKPGSGGIEAWLRFGEAMGLSREELLSERHVLPGVRYAVDAYVDLARTRPWVEAVAASLSEQLLGLRAIRLRVEAFERYYPFIDPAGIDYFRARIRQAPEDAQFALDLVVERCTTRAEQEGCVQALAYKCDLLWAQLDAIDRGDIRTNGDDIVLHAAPPPALDGAT